MTKEIGEYTFRHFETLGTAFFKNGESVGADEIIETIEKLKAENAELRERIYKLKNREYKNIESLADHLKEVLEENQELCGLLREACKVINSDSYDLGIAKMDTGIKRCMGFLNKPEIKKIIGEEK